MPGRDLPDLEERLRRLPAALAVEAPAGLAERIARRGHQRRRLRRATAAALVVALLGGAVATRLAVLDHAPTPVLNPGLVVPGATPEQLARGRWQALPPMPSGLLARRTGAAVVWTGHELIVWGGASRDLSRTYADGAVYNPGTGRWAPLPPAPEGQWLQEDRGLVVWTGREVLVWGGITIPDPVHAPRLGKVADGVAYDPARRTWRRLPARPAALEPLAGDRWTVWTGRELLAVAVEEAGAGAGVVAGAYDPAANRWRVLPQSPTLTGGSGHLRARTAVWAGSRLLVWNYWSRAARAANDLTGAFDHPDVEPAGIDLWAYDPASDRWTVLPAPPKEVRGVVAEASMVWTGQEVAIASARVDFVAGKYRTTIVAGRYDPVRARWTPIAPLPLRPAGHLILVWAGAAVVAPYKSAVYDPAAGRWLRLPAEPDSAANPPLRSWGVERALLRTHERATGGVQVYVLVPAKPTGRP
jgi:hypothetical protein